MAERIEIGAGDGRSVVENPGDKGLRIGSIG